MIIDSDFQPAFYLRSAHAQTVFASSVRRSPPLTTRSERVELPDGDFLDLAWLPDGQGPIIIVLHGLTGSLESKYARGLLAEIQRRGWRGLLMQFRGASGEPNRLPQGYHSGQTEDLDYIVRLLHERHPGAPLAAVGYSMGGNILLKWLGEQGEAATLATAVAVSVPFDLAACARAVNQGLSRVYQAHLLKGMRAMAETKFARVPAPFELTDLAELKDFFAFDDAVTAPLHGFADARDYYEQSSSGRYVHAIRRPTLVIHALDDPFMTPAVVPTADQLSDQVCLELSAHGGHVGFVSADRLGRPRYWLEQRIPDYLANYFGLPPAEPD